MKDAFLHSVRAFAKLLGHSLGAALGFTGLAAISLIPVGVMHLLAAMGMTRLASVLDGLETLLLLVDVGLFAVVFLAGVIAFLADVFSAVLAKVRGEKEKNG